MSEHTADDTRGGCEYRAFVNVIGGIVFESVVNRTTGEIPHGTQFLASRLGDADRDEYTRVMLSSVLDAMGRESRPS